MATYSLQLDEAERARYRMMAAHAVQAEGELWARAGVVPGAAVADVGCGPGATLVELARAVGPEGRAVGVEPAAEARQAARQELDGAGLAAVGVVEGTAGATGLEPGAFDCVMVRHVLAHNQPAEVAAALAHLAGLLRPGGHLYVVDTDLDAFRSSPADPAMEAMAERYSAFHRSLGNDPRIGPQLPALLAGAGLAVVVKRGEWLALPGVLVRDGGPLRSAQAAMVAAGVASEAELAGWDSARHRFADVPGATIWAPMFLAVGQRLA